MNENETITVGQLSDSKTPIVIVGLAVIGGAAVAKKAFEKARSYRIVRKSKLEALKTPPVES